MHILPLSAKEIEERLSKIPVIKDEIVDQEYDPESANAQSGFAVAEAVANTTYTNSDPLLNDLGGIKASEHTDGFNNVLINDLLTELLYPYTKPVINSFTLNPAAGVKKKGVPITFTSATATITKKSKAIATVDLYKSGALLRSISGTDITAAGTTITFSDLDDTLDGNADTTYVLKVSEQNGTPDVTIMSAAYTFVNPYYQGVIDKDSTLTASLITGLNEKVETKGNKTFTYTTSTDQCALIAYPASYGELSEIKDPNGFTQTWTKHSVIIDMVEYLVYISTPAAATDCKYTFSY